MNGLIGIVMSSFNRGELTKRTLDSIVGQNDTNYVVVVIDEEPTPLIYDNEHVIILESIKGDRVWRNATAQQNQAMLKCIELGCECIIMQNAEAYHAGAILSFVRWNLKEDDYISFPCASQKEAGDMNSDIAKWTIENQIPEIGADGGWYNHKHKHPSFLDFCVATSTANWKKLNGHDERFADKIWYNDNNLVSRVYAMGLNMYIPESPCVIHQWHTRSYQSMDTLKESFDLFNQTLIENTYRAKHIYTKDLDSNG